MASYQLSETAGGSKVQLYLALAALFDDLASSRGLLVCFERIVSAARCHLGLIKVLGQLAVGLKKLSTEVQVIWQEEKPTQHLDRCGLKADYIVTVEQEEVVAGQTAVRDRQIDAGVPLAARAEVLAARWAAAAVVAVAAALVPGDQRISVDAAAEEIAAAAEGIVVARRVGEGIDAVMMGGVNGAAARVEGTVAVGMDVEAAAEVVDEVTAAGLGAIAAAKVAERIVGVIAERLTAVAEVEETAVVKMSDEAALESVIEVIEAAGEAEEMVATVDEAIAAE